jgi:hypothetical protein
LQAFFVGAVGWCVCVAWHPLGTRRRGPQPERLESGDLWLLCRQFAADSNH